MQLHYLLVVVVFHTSLIIVLPSHSCGGALQNLHLKLLHSCWPSEWTAPSQQYHWRKRWDLVSLLNLKSEKQVRVSGHRLFHARTADLHWRLTSSWHTAWTTGQKPSVADSGGGMSASCITCPTVH